METILLVEDDEMVRRLFHNYLESCGYNLIEARDGDEALLLADLYEDSIEYLVTDLVMPKLGGLETGANNSADPTFHSPDLHDGVCSQS